MSSFLFVFIYYMLQALRCYCPGLDAINSDQQPTLKQNRESAVSFIIT